MGARCNLFLAIIAVAIGYFLYLNQALDAAAVLGKQTMRCIYFARYGAPSDVLEMVEVPMPSYRSWEILVEVHAASINPVDYKIVQGNFFLIDFLLTHRPGFDFSGKVVAVGKDCEHVQVGDVVHGMTWVHKTGSLAEYLAVDESVVNVVPKGMSEQEAAALPLVAHTSYSSLVTMGGLRQDANQSVLVLGGSTATGMMALQLARAYGAAHVVSTCSPRNDALVRSLGADDTINYREQDVFDEMLNHSKTFDIVYDTVGGISTWQGASSGVLAAGGQFVTITGDIQRTLDIADLLSRGYQIVTRKLYCLLSLGGGGYHQYTQPGGNRQELMILDTLVKNRKLKSIVEKTYSFNLDQVKEAFEYLMAGHASGKVVIQIIS
eukprot:TRINITY_DN32092_c0_g1_i1.p1 TRINITY_DN32092_c0_g1~~TRINITY_DN32092_c0_g1_i1.p1  ORF type:complete len:379 (-),score=61.85 TRINITY_DN32092_c0_g1_i1:359-1495(-)